MQHGFFYGSLAWCAIWGLVMVWLAWSSPEWRWSYLGCALAHLTCARVIWVSRPEGQGVE